MRFLFILLFFFVFKLIVAQNNEFHTQEIWEHHKIKADVLSPFWYLREIRIAYEFPLAAKQSVQLELSLIENHLIRKHFTKIPEKIGFRIKADYRYYFYIFNNEVFYFSPEFFYKYEDINEQKWFYRHDYSYQQLINLSANKNVFVLHFKIGIQAAMSKRFINDFYIGGGFRYKHYDFKSPSPPKDAVIYQSFIVYESYEDTFIPSFCMGWQIGFVVK